MTVANSESTQSVTISQFQTPTSPSWDVQELLERLDGDEELLRELLTLFQADSRAVLLKAKECFSEKNWQALSRTAHTLRGMLRNLSMNVLIAEDDALSRVLLERILQRAGYAVKSVENGRKALEELAKDDPPRLVLLDWVMPEKDGVQVCHEVRRRRSQAYTYMILLSSKESKKDIVYGLEAGADDYLTKPFDADELKARLRAGERILDLEDRLVEARESMRFQATHDLLTNLWNRGVIIDLLSNELLRAQRERVSTAVMMCDIDHFKAVNDEYGHSVGDDVLREVSRRLHHSVRSYDMVGRYGGEEFLVVLNKCEPSTAVSRAENLRAAISAKAIMTSAKPVRVTISVGLALTLDYPGCNVEEIIHSADSALYAAKRSGRNCVRLAHPPAELKIEDTVSETHATG